MNIKKYVNVNDFVFDIIVGVILILGIDFILPGGRRLIDIYSPLNIWFITFIGAFFLMLLLGDIYQRYMAFISNGFIAALIKVIFFLAISSIYMAILLFFSSFHAMPFDIPNIREFEIITVLLPVYPIVWGLSIGFSPEDFNSIKYTLYIPGMLAIALIPAVSLRVGYYFAWLLALAAFLILVVAMGGPFAIKKFFSDKRYREIFRRIREARAQNKSFSHEDLQDIYNEMSTTDHGLTVAFMLSGWQNILFPVLCAAGIILWQKVTVELMIQIYKNWNSPPDYNTIFWMLIWTGIVPIRILSEIAPPWKLINSIVAAGILAYYVFTLYVNFH